MFDTNPSTAYPQGTVTAMVRTRGGSSRWTVAFTVLGLGLLVASEAFAQKPNARPPAPPSAPTGQRPGAEAPVEVPVEQIPLATKQANVEKYLKSQRDNLAAISELVQAAEAERDVILLTCLETKLEQVKGLLRISNAASTAMFEGIAKSRPDKVNNEYTKVALAAGKSQVITAEANQCVGSSSVFTGETEVSVTVDGEVEGLDPTEPIAPPPGPPVPPVASGS